MLAFVFPGQGAQKVGMGCELAARYPAAQRVFERADDALGFSISKLCFEGPDSELVRTANSQPAILTTSVAVCEVVQEALGIEADVVAGHSLGEYSALVAAGTLSLEDAVRLVHKRGLFMQEAVPEGRGAMAALIGLEQAEVEALCAEVAQGQVLAPANLNGGGQVVIAGETEAVRRAVTEAKRLRARAIPLKVSAPFHCALMAPAADRLAEEIARVSFADPRVPVITNVEAEANRSGRRAAELLIEQVVAPVQWEASVRCLAQMGARHVLELGPGKTLSGLVRRIEAELEVDAVGSPQDVDALRARKEAETARLDDGAPAAQSAKERLM